MVSQWKVAEPPHYADPKWPRTWRVYRTLREGVHEFWPHSEFYTREKAHQYAENLNQPRQAADQCH
jgi:hypothetical protein